MDIRKLQRAIVNGLEDVKAQHIVVFNTEALSPLFERVIIASGTSNRQTKALAASVRDAVRSAGAPVPRTEGEDNGEWIIVDCGAAVAHIMQPAIRDYYRLEEIWGVKPVTLKSLTVPARKGLPKAGEAPPTATATKKAAVTRTTTAKASPRAPAKASPKTVAATPAKAPTTRKKAAGPAPKPPATRRTKKLASGTPAKKAVRKTTGRSSRGA